MSEDHPWVPTDLQIEHWRPGNTTPQSEGYKKLDRLAMGFAKGYPRTPAQAEKIAKKYGFSVAEIEMWKNHPRMGERVREFIRQRGLDYTARALKPQAEKAMEGDTNAFYAVAKVGGVVGQPNQINVNTQVNVQTRQGQDPERVQMFIQRMRERQGIVLKRRMGMEAVEVECETVEDGSHAQSADSHSSSG